MTEARTAAEAVLAAMAAARANGDIRALRDQSNAAIAARDLDGVMASVGARTVMVEGGGGVMTGRAAIRAAWKAQFADPSWIAYVRTPDEIRVAQAGDRAAESGDWLGRFRVGASEGRLSGRYFVHWVLNGGEWRVLAETYVTLSQGLDG